MELQDVHQQILLRVHHNLNAAAFEPAHDPLVHITGKGVGHASGDDENVSCLQRIELFIELFDIAVRDVRSLAVDLGLFVGFHLQIDPGQAFRYVDKIGGYAELLQSGADLAARKAGHKAEGRAVVSEILQHDGDVDPLAARENVLVIGPVDGAGAEILHTDDVVQRGIKGDCVNHVLTPPEYVCRSGT